jgi:hypothetical protein
MLPRTAYQRPESHDIAVSMMAFPRIMIAASGILGLVILTLAGVRLFPTHAGLAGWTGAIIGGAINIVLQYRLYRP